MTFIIQILEKFPTRTLDIHKEYISILIKHNYLGQKYIKDIYTAEIYKALQLSLSINVIINTSQKESPHYFRDQ